MNIFKWLTNRKYRLFYHKIKDVQIAIWEQDFKIAKSRQVREGVRQDRERALEAASRVKTAFEAEQDPEKKKNLETEMNNMVANSKRYEAQMKMIDDQINGVPPSGENPGEQGVLDTIQSLAELKEMYKQYLKEI